MLNERQFSGLNVNQLALPGMEEHAHAGAKLLSEGWRFEYDHLPKRREHYLGAIAPGEDNDYDEGSRLQWASSEVAEGRSAYSPGEIKFVESDFDHRGQGVPTALYRMASDPAAYTGDDTVPVHSTDRTREGRAWGQKVGGPTLRVREQSAKMPAPRRGLHPFEQREMALSREAADRSTVLHGQERLL